MFSQLIFYYPNGGFLGFINLICGVLLFSVLSCSPEPEPDYLPVNFTVNQQILGLSYISSQVPFSIDYPLDVQAVDSVDIMNFRESIQADTNAYFKIELLDMKRSTAGMVVTVSLIDSAETASRILNDNYLEQLKTTFNTESIIRNKVSINKIPTIQFIVTSENYINIKLFLILEPSSIQVDYFIPSHQYSEKLEQIESSIGSISHKKKEEKK